MAHRITRLASSSMCSCLAASVAAQAAHAAVWSEVNAGATPATAEAVVGNPAEALIRIQGTIDPSTDGVDLYRISITNAAAFSALTTNGSSTDDDLQFDAKLALFRANGLGVYTNDDVTAGNGNASLPAGHALSPVAPGQYLLAIYDDDYEAVSVFSPAGVIFAADAAPWTSVRGPTGPGGANPLIGFGSLGSQPADPRNYTIELTGTSLPEADRAVGLIAGAAALAAAGRLRRSAASSALD